MNRKLTVRNRIYKERQELENFYTISRLIAIPFILAFLMISKSYTLFFQYYALTSILLMIFFVDIIYYWKRLYRPPYIYITAFFDVIFLLTVIFLTGGINSPFVFGIAFQVAQFAIRYGVNFKGYMLGILYHISYGMVGYMVGGFISKTYFIYMVIVQGLFIWLVYITVGNLTEIGLATIKDVYKIALRNIFEDKLKTRLKIIRETIYNVDQEIHDPLTIIFGSTGLLKKREGIPDDIKKSIEVIKRNAEKIDYALKKLIILEDQELKNYLEELEDIEVKA